MTQTTFAERMENHMDDDLREQEPELSVSTHPNILCATNKRYDKYGVIRIEEWPEGLVLWVGGQIRWKSWTNQ